MTDYLNSSIPVNTANGLHPWLQIRAGSDSNIMQKLTVNEPLNLNGTFTYGVRDLPCASIFLNNNLITSQQVTVNTRAPLVFLQPPVLNPYQVEIQSLGTTSNLLTGTIAFNAAAYVNFFVSFDVSCSSSVPQNFTFILFGSDGVTSITLGNMDVSNVSQKFSSTVSENFVSSVGMTIYCINTTSSATCLATNVKFIASSSIFLPPLNK